MLTAMFISIVLAAAAVLVYGIIIYNQKQRDKEPILLLGHMEDSRMSVAQCQFCHTVFLYPRLKVPVKCPKCYNIKIPS